MFDIQVNISDAAQLLRGYERQIPFAIATAMNRTGEDANAAIRDSMHREFTIRDKRLPQFVAPTRLRPDQRATKQNLSVVLETEGSGRILNPFQIGEPKRQRSELEPVAIPTDDLRFNDRTVIPRKWYPHNLGLTPRRDPTGSTYFALGRGAKKNKKTPFSTTGRGAVQIKGKHRTFVLDPKHHRGISPQQWGVYIRIGPEPNDIRMLWQFARQVPRPPILKYYEVAHETWTTRWPINLAGAVELALRTAR